MTPSAILAAATPRTLSLPEREMEIALLDWGGAGPLALLHHANGFCKGVWGLVAWELRQRFRVVAIDARGHGDSSVPTARGAYEWNRFAEDLVAVSARLAAETADGRIALGLGHSFGGTTFLAAARRRPELFERLLLLDPVVRPTAEISVSPAYQGHVQRMVEGARRRRSVFASRDEARALWSQRPFFARCDARAVELYALDGLSQDANGTVALKCAPETEAAVFAGGPETDTFSLAAGIAVPTVVQWAARGNFPRAMHEQLAAGMTRGVVEAVDCGHLVPMERPDLVVAAALR